MLLDGTVAAVLILWVILIRLEVGNGKYVLET
jgi:hypothetical protein